MPTQPIARRIGAGLATAGLGLVTLVAVSAPASAAIYPVTDEATYRSAVSTACADGSEGSIIDISGVITIAGAAPITCVNDQSLALRGVTADAAIVGTDGGAPLLDATIDDELTLQDFTISGFTSQAVLVDVTGNLQVRNMTVKDNTFTVEDTATNASAYAYGGAINVAGASAVTIDGSSFLRNSVVAIATGDSGTGYSVAEASGGAVYIDVDVVLTITDSSFTNNVADATLDSYDGYANAAGGAVFHKYGDFQIGTDSSFSGNHATVDATVYVDGVETRHDAEGGALYGGDGDMLLFGGTFTGNYALGTGTGPEDDFNIDATGGAIFLTQGAEIHGTTFTNNYAKTSGPDAGAYGGAIAAGFEGNAVTIDDSTLTGNYAKATVSADTHTATVYGGALYVDSGYYTGSGNTYKNNYASATAPTTGEGSEAYGGAVYSYDDVNIDSDSYSGNSATATGGSEAYAYGGAIEGQDDVTPIDSTFSKNKASATSTLYSEVYGGAVDSWNTMDPDGATFTGNAATAKATDAIDGTAEVYGGAISADYSLYIQASTFTGNSAKAVGPSYAWAVGGGAADLYDGFNASESEFADNTVSATAVNGEAYAFGGGLGDDPDESANTGSRSITSSTFADNVVDVVGDDFEVSIGGGVYATTTSAMLVTNSTFAGNAANSTYDADDEFVAAGGVANDGGGELQLLHVTMSGNEGNDSAHAFAEGVITSTASIFVDAVGGLGCDTFDGVTSGGYNFEDALDGTCTDGFDSSSDYEVLDDILEPDLADNGGPTRTLNPLPGTDLIDYIDIGTTVYDQRGVERPVGLGIEPGAVEYLDALTFTVTTDAGDINGVVYNASACDPYPAEVTVGPWESAEGYDPAPPSNLSVPYGVFSYLFCVPDSLPDWTVTVVLEFPTPVNSFWKVSDTEWTQIKSAVIDGNFVEYQIANGGPYDEADADPSIIVDPAAGGVLASFTG